MTSDLSVVIICRNEQETIGRCIASVLEETGEGAEVILVDSASTDGTVNVARRFPVTVVQLDSTSLLSPSAGRYIGSKFCTRGFIFFIDGDMIVYPGWARQARESIQGEKLGGVNGRLYWVFPGEELHLNSPDRLPTGSLEYLGGAAVYKRSVLQKCGSFHPFLLGEEERELGQRIRKAGFSLKRLDVPMAYHIAKPRTVTEIDEKARYFTGVGQIIRAYGLHRISLELLKEQRLVFGWFAGTALILLLAITLLMMDLHLPLAALGFAIVILFTVLLAAKGWKKVYLYFRGILLSGVNIAAGLRTGLPAPDKYGRQSSYTVVSHPPE
jgi:glycosyltransferase involved in cell wall biosynthesis